MGSTELLAQERAAASFPVRELTYFLDGSPERTEKLERLKTQIERTPAFTNDDYYELPGEHLKLRERTMVKVAAMAEMISQQNTEGDIRDLMMHLSVLDPGAYTRVGVHFGLFLAGVRGSGTSQQLNHWVSIGAGSLRNFFGCFGMTELGHGSNVAGVETTATFDKDTDEFVINTPSVTATKWWIGGAAHTATHCLVFARLIVDGKDYGVKNFVVPLRDRHDWSLLPGIAIGDIGKKMGRDGIDNGWIQFSSVRIPRQYMMMKYSKVSRDGKVTQPPLAQLAYGALIGGRVSMVLDSFVCASRVLTIAIRYAAVRRQGSVKKGEEIRLLDYAYHQRRLLPLLAYCYAMKAGGVNLVSIQESATSKLASTDPKSPEMASAVSDVKELFSVSAGLKAFSTWGTAQIIDECRQACGGHGYSAYNGFGQTFNDWAVQCTWEGDNNVLTLSAGRALLQTALSLRKGKSVGESGAYIGVEHKPLGADSLEDPNALNRGFRYVAARAINDMTDSFEKYSGSFEEKLEKLSKQRFNAARLHSRAFLVAAFFKNISSAKKELQPVLLDLATLFALWSIEQESTAFLQYGFLPHDRLNFVSELVDKYCGKIRVQAVALCDAFNWSDFFINSPIGNYDGDVYNNYFQKVTSSNSRLDTKAPYYETVMKPFFKRPEPESPDLEDLEDD